ncbi:hypothetical protein CH063_08390 [Colletotrichum higginsianum]|uniref:Uncharacterized protein n=1 Tax=Colletotrichum higginsianum (strain IMI 349063) TaxID=759273 RepID=H1V9N2_COLHI|nr:hypothetical protein CH063_08390 [Colletotrichum higginsianum]
MFLGSGLSDIEQRGVTETLPHMEQCKASSTLLRVNSILCACSLSMATIVDVGHVRCRTTVPRCLSRSADPPRSDWTNQSPTPGNPIDTGKRGCERPAASFVATYNHRLRRPIPVRPGRHGSAPRIHPLGGGKRSRPNLSTYPGDSSSTLRLVYCALQSWRPAALACNGFSRRL